MTAPDVALLSITVAVVALRMGSALDLGARVQSGRGLWTLGFVLSGFFSLLSIAQGNPLWIDAVLVGALIFFAVPTFAVWCGPVDHLWSSFWLTGLGLWALITFLGDRAPIVPLAVTAALLAGRLLLLPRLVRRGAWRAALALAHSLDPHDAREQRAGRALLAALRALRNGLPVEKERPADAPVKANEEALAWLEQRQTTRLGWGSTLFTRGMVAAARGDEDTAWYWLAGIVDLSEDNATLWEKQAAAEWLCGAAASEGSWERVGHYARRLPRQTEALAFWAAAHDAVMGTESNSSLPACPPHLRPLLEHLRTLPPPPDPYPASSADATLEDVIRLHLTVCLRGSDANDAAALCDLGRAWDRIIDEVPPDARMAVLIDACHFIVGRSLADDPEHAPALVMEARGQILEAYTLECMKLGEALYDRVVRIRAGDEDARLPLHDEWLEHMRLRLLYGKGSRLGGAAFTIAAWPAVHHALNNQATTLPVFVSHEMFRWLAAEAAARGDERALELETSNVRASEQAPEEQRPSAPQGIVTQIAILALIFVVRMLAEFGGPSRPPSPTSWPTPRGMGSSSPAPWLQPTPSPSASPSRRASTPR